MSNADFVAKLNAKNTNFENEYQKTLRESARSEGIPVMLAETSKLLATIISAKKPVNILEIGTAVGYSGSIMLSFAEKESRLTTIEIDEKNAIRAKETFEKLGFFERVTLHIGDAEEIVPLLSGSFDFILCDGPKSRYLEFYPYLKKLLKSGGVLFCDNVLFRDYVSGEVKNPHRMQTIVNNMRDFLKTLCADDEFIATVLEIGDGVSIATKK